MSSKLSLTNVNGKELTIINDDTNTTAITINGGNILAQTSTIASLRTMVEIPNTVYVTGYTTANDNAFGSNFFKWNPTSTIADNGGTIIKLTGTLTGRYELQYSGAVNVKWFGAVGDGIADDTVALSACFSNSNNIIGNTNETYKLTGVITSIFNKFKLKDISIISDSNIATFASIVITATNIIIDNLTVDLGRNTYKTGIESWSTFAVESGTPSITPILDSFLKITATSIDAVIKITNCSFFNIPNKDAVWIRCYGDVFLNSLTFKNCAEKTYNIYHTDASGVVNLGRTFADNVSAISVGILPNSFYVDNVLKTRADNYAPQASFNFVVTYGEYYLSNAYCKDYASTGITADRNTYFNGVNIVVESSDINAWSNNPSGAIWDENCISFNLNNATVNITNRDSRDMLYDSSALQLYSTGNDYKRNISNLTLTTTAKVKYAVRGSKLGNTSILLSNIKVNGESPINLAGLPNDIVSGSLVISGLTNKAVASCTLNCSGFADVLYSNIQGNFCDIVIKKADNSGVTGDLNSIKITNSAVQSFLCKDTILNGLTISSSNFTTNVLYTDNMGIGRFTVDSCNIIGRLAYTPVTHILPVDRRMNVSNSIIGNGIRAFSLESLIVSGNELKARNIQIDNIRYVTIADNFIKSLSAEPVVHLTTTNGSYRIVTISDNTLLINEGVVGGAYIVAPALTSPYQIQDINNIKVNFAI